MELNKLRLKYPVVDKDTLFVPLVSRAGMNKILEKNIGYFLLSTAESEKLEQFTLTNIDMKTFDPKKINRVIGVWQKNPPIIASAYDVSKNDLSIKDDKASWGKGDDQFAWIVDELAPKVSQENMVMGTASNSDVRLSLENPKGRNNKKKQND